MWIHTERANEIEKNNMNLFSKMRAIIRTNHTQWRQKLENRTYSFKNFPKFKNF